MANVYLSPSGNTTASIDVAANVFGDVGGQQELSIIPNGQTLPSGMVVAQTVEKVTLAGFVSDFTFAKVGTTGVNVYQGNTLVATINVQTDDDVGSNGTVLAFTMGSVLTTSLNIISATEIRMDGVNGQVLTAQAAAYVPPFVVTETQGAVSFSGRVTGDITLAWTGGNVGMATAIFTRGGVSATTINHVTMGSSITLNANDTLSVAAADLPAMVSITGAGSVALTDTTLPATTLIGFDNLYSAQVNATAVTTITGTAADIASVKGRAGITKADGFTAVPTAGSMAATDLLAIDLNNSTTVDAGLADTISGSATNIAAVIAATGITKPEAFNATPSDQSVSVADANAIDTANGTGVLTATITEQDSATLKNLTATDAVNAYTTTVADTTAAAADLIAIDAATSVAVGANSVSAITGSVADVNTVASAIGAGTIIHLSPGWDTTPTGTASVVQANNIDANNGAGVITATITEQDSATLKNLTATGAVNAYTTTVADTTAAAADLNAIDAATSVIVGATAVTTINGNAADVKTVGSATGISRAANWATTVSGLTSVADANLIDGYNGNGALAAAITEGAVTTLKTLSGTTNAYTLTITDTSAAAADLIALDVLTTVAVGAGLVTTLTGSAADSKTVIAANGITKAANWSATPTDASVSVADANAIDTANGTGVLTATITEQDSATLKNLTATGAVNAYTVTVAEGTAAAADLIAIDAATSVAVGANSVSAITGSVADVNTVASAIGAGTIIHLSPGWDTTPTGTASVVQANNIDANNGVGVITASISGLVADLATLTSTGGTNVYTATATDIATGVTLPTTVATYNLGNFTNSVTLGTTAQNVNGDAGDDTVALGVLNPTGTIALGAGTNHVTATKVNGNDISAATITALGGGTADLTYSNIGGFQMNTAQFNLFSATGITFGGPSSNNTISLTNAGNVTAHAAADAYSLATGINITLNRAAEIVWVNASGGYSTQTPSNVITGAVAGNVIAFNNDNAASNTPTLITLASGTVAGDIDLLTAAATVAHKVVYGVSTTDNNTYVMETLSGTVGANDTTLIELTGAHTLAYQAIWNGTSLVVDTIMGTTGIDTLTGGPGNDTITGLAGDDTMTGGAGADTFKVDSGTDTITDFGTGADVLVVSASAVANLTLTGGADASRAGSSNAGTINFNSSAISAGTGSTTAFVGNVTGGGTNVLNLSGTSFDDNIFDNGALVNIQTINITNASVGGSWFKFDDQNDGFTINVTSSANSVHVQGNTGNDVINGGAANDIIDGSGGIDTITGGLGADNLTGGAGTDTFVFAPGDSTLANMDTITNYRTSGTDLINLTGVTATSNDGTPTVDAGDSTGWGGVILADALDIAAQANNVNNGTFVFQFLGDTYVYVESNGAETLYAAGDTVIKLTGLIGATAGVTTIAGFGIDGI